VSYIDLIVERQIAAAIERGELEVPPALKGRPLPDLDQVRPAGWWAEQFARREQSRLERDEARQERDAWCPRLWRAATRAELEGLVAEANARVDALNERLVADDALDPFVVADVVAIWQRLRAATR
jgi:hypothetical protein